MSEEKIRLTLETAGTENVRQASKAVQDLEASVDSLDDSIKNGVIKSNGEFLLNLKNGERISANSAEGLQKLATTMKQFMVTNTDGTKTLQYAVQALDEAYRAQKRYEEQVWQSSRSVDDLQDSHVALYQTMQSRVAPAMDAHVVAFKKYREATELSERTTQAFGRRMLEASYMADDLQYGFRGIVNNIPRFADAFGVSATMVGTFGIAAVGVNQALQILGPLITDTESPLKKHKETLAELTDVTKAQEEAIKRQRDEIEKLSKSNSQRIEDILKLKSATEDLQVAEARLAEDRKNQKAVEDAGKNAGVIADEELKKQKEVVKSVITDAGLQGDLVKNLSASIAQSTPAVDDKNVYAEASAMAQKETGPNAWAQLTPEAKANLTKRYMNRAKSDLSRKRDDQIKQSTEAIFGGLINPANQGEMDQAMQGLDQFLPGVSRELRNVYQFDQESAAFEAGNKRWQGSLTRAARRAAERDFAAGEKSAANMLPNAGTLDDERIRKTKEASDAAIEASARNAAIRNEVLGQYDPATLAARRYAMAPQNARQRAYMQKYDTQAYAREFMARGMSKGEAMDAANESVSGGNRSLQDFAEMTGRTLSNSVRAQETAVMYLRQQEARIAEAEARVNMINDQLNQMSNSQPRVRPQMNRARR